MRLVWAGSTIGSTASWPETMALWELRDWDHFAAVCDRMYTEHTDDARLAEWWRGSFRFRRRATSRVLIGAAYSPTLDELRARGVSGTTFAFTRFSVVPGKVDDLLAALERRVPLDAELGRRLVGAYEVAFTNDAAYAIWAFPGLVEAGAYQEAVARDERMRDWQRSVEPLLARGTTEVWGFATPWCPLWPAGYRTEARIW